MKFEIPPFSVLKSRFREYNGWFVVIAAGITAVLALLHGLAPNLFRDALDQINFNAVLLGLGMVILLVTVVSYPRVYKLKVLLSGFAVASVFLLIFLMRYPLHVHSPFTGAEWNISRASADLPFFATRFLLLLFSLNMLAVMVVPSRVNYTAGRKRSVIPFFANLVVFVLALFILSGFSDSQGARGFFVGFLRAFHWIMAVLFLGTAALSAFRIEEDHNYGAILVSLSLVIWVASWNPQLNDRMLVFLIVMGVVLLAGIVYHVLESLKYGARIDPLLKIFNRQYMGSILSGVAEVHLGNKLSILISDIDHFKHVNDNFGHQAGDAVLYAVAQEIRKVAEPEGIACRYGGEEIIIFLRDVTGDGAKKKAEAIRKAVEKLKIIYGRKKIPVTTSIGVSCKDGGSKNFDAMIHEADKGLYEAKRTGRNKVVMG